MHEKNWKDPSFTDFPGLYKAKIISENLPVYKKGGKIWGEGRKKGGKKKENKEKEEKLH